MPSLQATVVVAPYRRCASEVRSLLQLLLGAGAGQEAELVAEELFAQLVATVERLADNHRAVRPS